ncbi:MAG: hypothetical protein ACI935_003779, partial [Moritella dasanensis]
MRPITFFFFLLIILSSPVSGESVIQNDAGDLMLAEAVDQNSWYRQGDRWLKEKVTSLQAQS